MKKTLKNEIPKFAQMTIAEEKYFHDRSYKGNGYPNDIVNQRKHILYGRTEAGEVYIYDKENDEYVRLGVGRKNKKRIKNKLFKNTENHSAKNSESWFYVSAVFFGFAVICAALALVGCGSTPAICKQDIARKTAEEIQRYTDEAVNDIFPPARARYDISRMIEKAILESESCK